MNQNKITLHVNIDRKSLELFDSLYPRCRQRFIDNVFQLASQDKAFFQKIFFKDILESVNNSI